MLLKEACLENFTNVAKVITNGAKRLELCDNLGVGGTTVSKGVLAETCLYAHAKDIPVIALIRPRGGDYVYNDIEVKIMEADIFEAQALGVDGISIGALTKDNKLDIEVLDQLIAASGGITAQNCEQIAQELGVNQLHGSKIV